MENRRVDLRGINVYPNFNYKIIEHVGDDKILNYIEYTISSWVRIFRNNEYHYVLCRNWHKESHFDNNNSRETIIARLINIHLSNCVIQFEFYNVDKDFTKWYSGQDLEPSVVEDNQKFTDRELVLLKHRGL
jgi:hypothetical protein